MGGLYRTEAGYRISAQLGPDQDCTNVKSVLQEGHSQVNRGLALRPLCVPVPVGHQHIRTGHSVSSAGCKDTQKAACILKGCSNGPSPSSLVLITYNCLQLADIATVVVKVKSADSTGGTLYHLCNRLARLPSTFASTRSLCSDHRFYRKRYVRDIKAGSFDEHCRRSHTSFLWISNRLLVVSTPSRSKLLWLDLLIASLQVTEALIVFRFIKTDSGEVRTATRSRRAAPSGAPENGAPSNGSDSGTNARVASNRSHAPSRGPLEPSRQRIAAGSRTATASSDQPSSTLFEYTPENASNDRTDDQDERTAEYYVDEEEVRFSVDNDRRPPQHRSSEAMRSSALGSGTDRGSESESEGSEDSFGADYEEILQQETFVFQLSLQDLTSYLFSSQDAVAFPRPPDPRTGIATAATSTQTGRVRNLPV